MVRSAHSFPVRLGAAFTVALPIAFAVLALLLPWPAEEEVTLGAAHRHGPSFTDFFARVSKGALDAAAGSANDLGYTRDTMLSPTEVETVFVGLVNADRAANGLGPLDYDPSLLGIARIRAASQRGGPLSHVDGLGQLAFISLLNEWEVPYTLAGENLARHSRNGAGTVDALERALMNSPTHRANILDPTFQGFAIGEALEGEGIAVAQIFRAMGS